MRSARHLPPLLRVLGVLGMLAPLASCGLSTWAFLLTWKGGEPPESLRLIPTALIALGLACIWPGVVYNARRDPAPFRRPRRAMPWLETWRGQLASALVLSVVPVAAVVVALLVSPATPLFWVAYASVLLSLLVFIATVTWALR